MNSSEHQSADNCLHDLRVGLLKVTVSTLSHVRVACCFCVTKSIEPLSNIIPIRKCYCWGGASGEVLHCNVLFKNRKRRLGVHFVGFGFWV